MLVPLKANDLRLSGQVIYTGRSSMEIAVKMEDISRDGTEETVLLGVPSTFGYPLLYISDLEFDRSLFHGV
jgi:hypothetical protein